MNNVVIVENGVARIQVCRYNGEEHEVLIDVEDLPLILEFASNRSVVVTSPGKGSRLRYAVINRNGRQNYVHRILTGFPDGLEVDHINFNGLDNRRRNIHVVTRSGNIKNRLYEHPRFSKAKHYRWRADRGVFEAQINIAGVPHLKSSVNEEVIIQWVGEMREKQKQARLAQLPKAA